eukprot:15456072-Alexandrium_andersonii.AAC.1
MISGEVEGEVTASTAQTDARDGRGAGDTSVWPPEKLPVWSCGQGCEMAPPCRPQGRQAKGVSQGVRKEVRYA